MSLLLLAALLLLPGAAMAAGMPQLDFSTPLTLSQVVWGIVIFVVLYVLASRLALPKVGEVLQDRAARIAADLKSAQEAKEKADGAVGEMHDAIAKARAEAQAAINAALDEAKKDAARQAETLNQRLEKQLEEAEASIAAARSTAMSALRQVALDTATTIVGRLTGAAPDPARVGGAIDRALAARQPA